LVRVGLIGSVESSSTCLEGLVASDCRPEFVCGLSPEFSAGVSGFVDLSVTSNSLKLPYCSFRKVTDESLLTFLDAHPADLLLVVGLSQLVPSSLLKRYSLGGLGFHPTMLPRGRGRAPVVWSLLCDEPLAVNFFFLVDEADAGDLVLQQKVDIPRPAYAAEAGTALINKIGEVSAELAAIIRTGLKNRTIQDHSRATVLPKREDKHGIVNFDVDAHRLMRFIRATSQPYPGSYCLFGENVLRFWSADVIDISGESGVVLACNSKGLVVGCKNGAVLVRKWSLGNSTNIQLEIPAGTKLIGHSDGCWDNPEIPPPDIGDLWNQ